MKKFLQKLCDFRLEEAFSVQKRCILNFISFHPEFYCLSLLTLTCLLFLFLGIGHYPLIDVDETRYAVMARDLIHSGDWGSLMLNGVPFLEKPPLYFWLVGGSVKFFHSFSPFFVRLPIALLTSFLVFFTYYIGKRVISRKFGMISAFVLVSSALFLILSHVAILDMLLTVFVASALYSGFLTHFCEEKNKKYYWFAFYIFVGLGFLTKGILAIVLPILIMFVYNLLTKTLKDMFQPVNFLPGVVAFLLISAPWHIAMYHEYGFFFVKEYFLKHHFARFINSVSIGRERPFLYFIPVFLLGFMPWMFTFIAFLVDGFKKLGGIYKNAQGNFFKKLFAIVDVKNNEQKMILFASLSFVIIFLLFSSSSTKLPTYILPAFPFAALLMGYYWWVADERSEHEKAIHNSSVILSVIFIILAFGGFLAYFFLPSELQQHLQIIKHAIVLNLFLLSMFLVLRIRTRRALSIFSAYILTMFFVITVASYGIFDFVYSTGENELVNYSKYASINGDKNSQFVTFDFSVKPSVLINYRKQVEFITDPEFDKLDKLVKIQKVKKSKAFVVTKNKNFLNNPKYQFEISKRLKIVIYGDKYSLFEIKN